MENINGLERYTGTIAIKTIREEWKTRQRKKQKNSSTSDILANPLWEPRGTGAEKRRKRKVSRVTRLCVCVRVCVCVCGLHFLFKIKREEKRGGVPRRFSGCATDRARNLPPFFSGGVHLVKHGPPGPNFGLWMKKKITPGANTKGFLFERKIFPSVCVCVSFYELRNRRARHWPSIVASPGVELTSNDDIVSPN